MPQRKKSKTEKRKIKFVVGSSGFGVVEPAKGRGWLKKRKNLNHEWTLMNANKRSLYGVAGFFSDSQRAR